MNPFSITGLIVLVLGPGIGHCDDPPTSAPGPAPDAGSGAAMPGRFKPVDDEQTKVAKLFLEKLGSLSVNDTQAFSRGCRGLTMSILSLIDDLNAVTNERLIKAMTEIPRIQPALFPHVMLSDGRQDVDLLILRGDGTLFVFKVNGRLGLREAALFMKSAKLKLKGQHIHTVIAGMHIYPRGKKKRARKEYRFAAEYLLDTFDWNNPVTVKI